MIVQLGQASPFVKRAAGTDSGATATEAAQTNRQHYITSISAKADADATLRITDGGTTVWDVTLDISVKGTDAHYTFPSPIPITPGAAVAGALSASTTACSVTIVGYTV